MTDFGDDRIPERIWNQLHPEPNTGCWLWGGDVYGRGRYGRTFLKSVKSRSVHVVTWTRLVGPIESGLELDHLCRQRLCANPTHLEPVTHEVNVQRGIAGEAVIKTNQRLLEERTHCNEGHEYTPENTRERVSGGFISRVCRECERVDGREKYARLKRDPERYAALRRRQNAERRARES